MQSSHARRQGGKRAADSRTGETMPVPPTRRHLGAALAAILTVALAPATFAADGQDIGCRPDSRLSACISTIESSQDDDLASSRTSVHAVHYPRDDEMRIQTRDDRALVADALVLAGSGLALFKEGPGEAGAACDARVEQLGSALMRTYESVAMLAAAFPYLRDLPAPGERLQRGRKTAWAYGHEHFDVTVEAFADGNYAFAIVKAWIDGLDDPDTAPADASTPAGDCAGPRIDAEEATRRIQAGEQVPACRIAWARINTGKDRQAEAARLPPVGHEVSGSFSTGIAAPLPDSMPLTQWRSANGRTFQTLGQARAAPPRAACE